MERKQQSEGVYDVKPFLQAFRPSFSGISHPTIAGFRRLSCPAPSLILAIMLMILTPLILTFAKLVASSLSLHSSCGELNELSETHFRSGDSPARKRI